MGPVTPEGAALLYNEVYERRNNYHNNTIELNNPNCDIVQHHDTKRAQKVAILGWYGTETLGDKAILAGIIFNLLEYGLNLENITLVSLRPAYSKLTLIELGMEKVNLRYTYELKDNPELIQEHDLYIFGGGPLCDIEEIVDMMIIFSKAKSLGKMTMIYGCGIGPLNNPRYQEALRRLIRNTDYACFRDTLSLEKYSPIIKELQKYDGNNCFIDPATNYLRNFRDRVDWPLIQEAYVLFSFRKWPQMYADGLNSEEFHNKYTKFEEQMIRVIEQFMTQGYRVVLMPMHNYFVGDDDREYYLNIVRKLRNGEKIKIISHDYTPEESINYFRHAKYAICMRFHSVVFSVSCNTPCIAIDYHYGKGKVSGFMETMGLEANLFDFDRWISSNPEEIVHHLQHLSIDWNRVNGIIDQKNEAMKDFMKVEVSLCD
jgi:polysaccharide pyruvyl transferase WcaK-like protein